MSVETWKADFYAVEACDTDQADAVAHSLQKWQGLLPVNLKRHQVRIDDFGFVVDAKEPQKHQSVRINGGTCALCHHYLVEGEGDYENNPCEMCPLYLARGQVACDSERDDEETAPWYEFRSDRADPRPMIFWLQKTLYPQP